MTQMITHTHNTFVPSIRCVVHVSTKWNLTVVEAVGLSLKPRTEDGEPVDFMQGVKGAMAVGDTR